MRRNREFRATRGDPNDWLEKMPTDDHRNGGETSEELNVGGSTNLLVRFAQRRILNRFARMIEPSSGQRDLPV